MASLVRRFVGVKSEDTFYKGSAVIGLIIGLIIVLICWAIPGANPGMAITAVITIGFSAFMGLMIGT